MKLNYCLMVTGPAYGNQRASNALQFAKTLLTCGHNLNMIFFYQEGVYNANCLTFPACDEFDIVREWKIFAQQKSIPLHICISASLRRGVIDINLAKKLNLSGYNLQVGFQLSSLSMLARAVLNCDRFIKF